MAEWAVRWRSYWGDAPPRTSGLADAVAAVMTDLLTERSVTGRRRLPASIDGDGFIAALLAGAFGDPPPQRPDWVTVDAARQNVLINATWGHRAAVIDMQLSPSADELEDIRGARALDVVVISGSSSASPTHAGPGRRLCVMAWNEALRQLRRSFPNEARATILADYLAAQLGLAGPPPVWLR